LRWEPEGTFDDEGAATVAPELLSPYKALATAVRNEERAFLFWTYVASQSAQDSLRKAAERMAREELGHLTTLRRERRRAFHQERATTSGHPRLDIAALERKLAALLSDMEGSGNEQADLLRELAGAASRRAEEIERRPLGASPLLADGVACEVFDRPVPLSELILDCYLDYSERLPSEMERERAQKLAAEAVECRAAFRGSRSP
jgi:hypothetical protein